MGTIQTSRYIKGGMTREEEITEVSHPRGPLTLLSSIRVTMGGRIITITREATGTVITGSHLHIMAETVMVTGIRPVPIRLLIPLARLSHTMRMADMDLGTVGDIAAIVVRLPVEADMVDAEAMVVVVGAVPMVEEKAAEAVLVMGGAGIMEETTMAEGVGVGTTTAEGVMEVAEEEDTAGVDHRLRRLRTHMTAGTAVMEEDKLPTLARNMVDTVDMALHRALAMGVVAAHLRLLLVADHPLASMEDAIMVVIDRRSFLIFYVCIFATMIL